MTLPTIKAFTDTTAMSAANHGADTVYSNDTLLAATLDSLDIATNIYNDKSAIIFGPVRVNVINSAVTLTDWVVPALSGDAQVELYALHISAIDGGVGGALSASHSATIQIATDTDNDGVFRNAGSQVVAGYLSYSVALDSDADRFCAEAGVIRVRVTAFTGSPNFHAIISAVGYVSNRSA